jgi:hypothetical protein
LGLTTSSNRLALTFPDRSEVNKVAWCWDKTYRNQDVIPQRRYNYKLGARHMLFLFLLRISIQALPLVAIAPVPILWASMLLLSVPVIYVRYQVSRDIADESEPVALWRWLVELSLLAIPPLSMLTVGLYFWKQHSVSRSPDETLAMSLLYSLAASHIILALWLIWRHRQRLWSTFGVSAVSSWWALGALFTGSMAATNTWL